MIARPVLAVMAKAPRPGEVKTRLCPPLSPAEAADLAGAFLLDAIDLARDVDGARLAIAFAPADAGALFRGAAPEFSAVPQRGDDLGARLRHVFEDVLPADGAGAIVVGSDLPTLPRAHLDEAVARLPESDAVLGPSEDGGYYLIGLRAPCPALFSDIAWSTDTVFDETMRRARHAGLRVSVLPPWFDVDTPADLERLDAALAGGGAGARHTRRFFAARAGAARP